MDSTIPADLLKLKTQLEAWRATRKYARQPIPDEFRQAAADMAGRYSPSLVRRILRLDPWLCCKNRMSRINDGRLSRFGILLGGLPVAETDIFKWRHHESEIILLCVRWYLRYALSYRDLEATVLKVKQKVAWRADAKPHYP